MNWEFHPEAEMEFLESIDYYEEHRTGLGLDFAMEVQLAIAQIVANPEAWPLVEEGIRRCQVNRFPFGIVYHPTARNIFVLAVMHLRRDPDYWRERTGD